MNSSGPERGASTTALRAAMIRATHQILDGQPKILADPIVGRLLGDEICRQIADQADDARDPLALALRSRVVFRSRFAEDRLAAAVQRGVRQYVILGAGFDTFAYRQPEWAHTLRIFEVDHPASQRGKHQRLERAGITAPANLEFVAIDFETVSLYEGLRRSGLDFSQPVFFSCLGVLIYLTREAAHAIFQVVAGFPAGSEIAFTFTTPGSMSPASADMVNAWGEPWQTHFEPDALAKYIHTLGFAEISILQPDQVQHAYFQGRTDGLHAARIDGMGAAVMGGAKGRGSGRAKDGDQSDRM